MPLSVEASTSSDFLAAARLVEQALFEVMQAISYLARPPGSRFVVLAVAERMKMGEQLELLQLDPGLPRRRTWRQRSNVILANDDCRGIVANSAWRT